MVADTGPPPRAGWGDHWLFPPGRTGGICPTDAHPHPDPRVGSQPAHGLQSTLQSEPKAVSTSHCGGGPGGGRMGTLWSFSHHQGPSFPSCRLLITKQEAGLHQENTFPC